MTITDEATEVENTANIETLKEALSDMTDRQLLEAVYISNQTLISQHEKIISLMAETVQAVGPLMDSLGDSAMARNILGMLGVKVAKPGKD